MSAGGISGRRRLILLNYHTHGWRDKKKHDKTEKKTNVKSSLAKAIYSDRSSLHFSNLSEFFPKLEVKCFKRYNAICPRHYENYGLWMASRRKNREMQTERVRTHKHNVINWNHVPTWTPKERVMAAINHSFILKGSKFPWGSQTAKWRRIPSRLKETAVRRAVEAGALVWTEASVLLLF